MAGFTLDQSAAFTNTTGLARDNSVGITAAVNEKWREIWEQAQARVGSATSEIKNLSGEINTQIDSLDLDDWDDEKLNLSSYAPVDFFDGVELPVFASDATLGGFVDPGAPSLDTDFNIAPGNVPTLNASLASLDLNLDLPTPPASIDLPAGSTDLSAFTPSTLAAPSIATPSFTNQTPEAALGGTLGGVDLKAGSISLTPYARKAPLALAIQDIMVEQFNAARPVLETPAKDSPLVALQALGDFTPAYSVTAPTAPVLNNVKEKAFGGTHEVSDLTFKHDVASISTPTLPTLDAIQAVSFGGYSVTQNAIGDFTPSYTLTRYTPPDVSSYVGLAPVYSSLGLTLDPKSFGGFSSTYDATAVGKAPSLDQYNLGVVPAPTLDIPQDVADIVLAKISAPLVAPDLSDLPVMGALYDFQLPAVPTLDWGELGKVTKLDIPPAPTVPDIDVLTDFSARVKDQEQVLRSELDRVLTETGAELRKLLPDFDAMREGAVKALVFGQVGTGGGNVAIKAFIDEHTVSAANMSDRLSNAAAVNLSGRGFTMPSGLLAAAQRRQNMEAMQLMTQGYSAAIRQGMDIISTHMLEGAKLSVDVHKYLEEAKFKWMTLIFEKMVEALRMFMDVELRQAELDISVYNAQVAMHKTNLEVLRMYMEQDKHKLDIARAQIDVFRSRVEAEQAKGQLNSVMAQVFEAKIRAYLSRVDVFRAQVEARGQEVQMIEQELGVYRAQLDGYRTKIEGQKAKIDIYKTQVEAEATKVRFAEADTALYRAKIDGQVAVIQSMQAEVDAFKSEIELENAKVGMINANTNAFRAEVDAYQARVSLADVDMKAFVIQSEVENKKADLIRSELDIYRTRIDAETAKLDIMKAERGSYDQEVQLEITKQNINSERLRAFSSQIQLEAAKASMLEVYGRAFEVEGRVEETKARVFDSRVQAFQAEVQAELANVDLNKGRVDIYRSQTEVENAKMQMVRTQADVFGSRAQVETQKMQILEAQERLYASKINLETSKVDLYKADVDAYGAYVASINSKVAVEQSRVDVYKAQVEADSTSVQALRTEVDAYEQAVNADAAAVRRQTNELEAMKARASVMATQASVYGASADIYKAQVGLEATKADLGSAKAQVVRAHAEMQSANANVYRAQVEAQTARLQAETTKVDAFKAQVGAHSSSVDAYKATIDSQRAVVEARTQKNRASVDAYVAQIEGQAAALRARAAAVEKEAAAYQAVTQRWGLALEARGKIAELDIAKIHYANTQAVEVYKANLARLEAQRALALEEVKLRVQGVTSQAQIHSTLAAGAMASINIGANMSTSASTSVGSQAGVNVSETRSYTDD